MKTEQKCEVNIIYCSRYYKLIVYGAEFCYNYNTISKSEEDEFVQIVNEKISRADLAKISGHYFGDMTKGVVDVEKEIVAIDAELHADLETLLLENGSRQEQLWGINLYPDENGEDFIEFDSLINIRPRQNNRGRGVNDPAIREKIREIIGRWFE
nr:DUF5674 family protein [Oscillibacter sp. MSJ-31]